jgi:hypothetical protein
MIAKVIMVNMLHTRIEPEAAAGVRMIKFAVNHPNRFQDGLWFAGCLAGFAKVTVIFFCEGLCIMAMLMQCDVVYVILSYIRYYALIFFDEFFVDAMTGVPLQE